MLKPILTEKSTKQASLGWYTFAVPNRFSKGKVKEVLKAVYDVDVTEIKTLKTRGRQKRSLVTRESFRTSDQKKALVRIKKGQKLAMFEVASPEGKAKKKS